MYLTCAKVNAEPTGEAKRSAWASYLDRRMTRAYRFSRNDEGLHVLYRLPVLLLLLQRDREAVCGRKKRIAYTTSNFNGVTGRTFQKRGRFCFCPGNRLLPPRKKHAIGSSKRM